MLVTLYQVRIHGAGWAVPEPKRRKELRVRLPGQRDFHRVSCLPLSRGRLVAHEHRGVWSPEDGGPGGWASKPFSPHIVTVSVKKPNKQTKTTHQEMIPLSF